MKSPLVLLLVAALLAWPAAGQTGFRTLYTFTNGVPGMLSRVNGVLYGTFVGWENSNNTCGSIFSLQPGTGDPPGRQWNETVLYNFRGNGDACTPTTALVPGPGGSLYGLSAAGGADGGGAFYELQPPAEPGGTWTETVPLSLSAFSGLVNGPHASFYVIDESADLLQLVPPAEAGGSSTAVDLFDFAFGHGALGPNSLIAGPDGILYGTSQFGRREYDGNGTVFQLTPPSAAGGHWAMQILHNFGTDRNAASDPIAVALASDGTLYGVTCGFGGYCGPPQKRGDHRGAALFSN
jgi:hypothetical protein